MTNNDSYFPEDYQVPRSDRDFITMSDFEQGDNVIRILDKMVYGYEGWLNQEVDGKKVSKRFQMDEKPEDLTPYRTMKHFWAVPVWNYAANRVQILTITQKSIQSEIHALGTDPDWGSPLGYDIKIKKEGQNLETTYTVTPKPASEIDPAIAAKWQERLDRGVDMQKVFTNENPFGKQE